MSLKKFSLGGKGPWIVIAIFVIFFAILLVRTPQPREPEIKAQVNRGCLRGEIPYRMDDNTMYDLLLPGKTYTAYTEWQKCIQLEQGDIVLYRYTSTAEPVARRVAAVPGDKIELVRNPEKPNWLLKVNGSLYHAKNKPYSFGSIAAHPISLYEKAHKGVLDEKAIVVFSQNPPGNRDSGDFGVVSVNDIVAIVSKQQMGFEKK